jgi:hypothetical protein
VNDDQEKSVVLSLKPDPSFASVRGSVKGDGRQTLVAVMTAS